MEVRLVEIVEVLLDRLERNGYQKRVFESDAVDANRRLTEAENWVAHWKQAQNDAFTKGELMQAEIETLRQQLAEAQPATCPECERLRAFVEKVREIMDRQYDGVEFDDLSRALAELDAGTTEPEGGT